MTFTYRKLSKFPLSNFSVQLKSEVGCLCWNYFGNLVLNKGTVKVRVLTDKTFCKVCFMELKSANENMKFGIAKLKYYSKLKSSAVLIDHLQVEHNLGPAQTRNSEYPEQLKKSLARDIAVLSAKYLIPLENNSSADFLIMDFMKKHNVIENKTSMPTREAIVRAFDEVYNVLIKHVKESIISNNDALNGSLAFDSWRDNTRNRNYITFSYKYITCDFELKSYTLCTCLIKNNTEHLNQVLDDLYKTFGLENITSFAASFLTLTSMRNVFPTTVQPVACLGQAFHNFITNYFKSDSNLCALIAKCKRIVKYIISHITDSDLKEAEPDLTNILPLLETAAEHLEYDENDPIPSRSFVKTEVMDFDNMPLRIAQTMDTNNIPTRWHCVVDLLTSIIRCGSNEVINQLLEIVGGHHLKMIKSEFISLCDILSFLAKFKGPVKVLRLQNQTSINLVLIVRAEISAAIEDIHTDNHLLRLPIITKDKLNLSFPITKLSVAATLLDCRFQGIEEVDYYLATVRLSKVKFLASYIVNHNGGEKDDRDDSTTDYNARNYLLKLSEKHSLSNQTLTSNVSGLEDECRKYFSLCSPLDLPDGNLLKYWHDRRATFPRLAQFARSILHAPATSMSYERMFTVAGTAAASKRSHLPVSRLNKILFVHENYNNDLKSNEQVSDPDCVMEDSYSI